MSLHLVKKMTNYSIIFSSFLTDTAITAKIDGTKGKIYFDNPWFCHGKVKVSYMDGTMKIHEFEFKSNGYEFAANKVAGCLGAGKIQSALWSRNDSVQLKSIMGVVRKECGIVYPKHDN